MCGFCGLYGLEASDSVRDTLTRMTETLVHRGPDARGLFLGDGVALGHTRLSIIDLSETGAQPMTVGSVTVTYNGECYNFEALRKELIGLGREFKGRSDTEVLLHAYDVWGLAGLERLEGIFAFALWDAERHRLVLMRDRLGIKPLYYAWQGQRLGFGSEIKSVLAGLDLDRSVDAQALAEYLWYGNAYDDRTLFQNVRVLPAGHQLIVENGDVRIRPWWRIEDWLEHAPLEVDMAEAAAKVSGAIDAAVRRQLVSDVPVALFLSGGLDSSSIAAAAAASGRKLTSLSVGFDFAQGVNELPKARRVADEFGLDHSELHVSGGSLDEVLVSLVRAHDEPFADAASIPLYLLSQEIQGSFKVVLQGDGGDEMFAGYRRYALLNNAAFWRQWPIVVGKLLRVAGVGAAARLERLGIALGQRDAAMRMALLLTIERLADPPTAMLIDSERSRLEDQSDPFLAYRNCADRFANADPVHQMLLTDISLQLPSQFLAKVDRATMAQGIEARVPLLDEHVASFAVALPSALKVKGAAKKAVLREAMRDRLPASILNGPKTGFSVPYEEWLRQPLYSFAKANLLEREFLGRFGFDEKKVANALDEHRSGSRDRGFLLWKLLHLALWTQEYLV